MCSALQKLLDRCGTTLEADELWLAEQALGPPHHCPTVEVRRRVAVRYRVQWKRSLRRYLWLAERALCAATAVQRCCAGTAPPRAQEHAEMTVGRGGDGLRDVIAYLETWGRELLPELDSDAEAAVQVGLRAVQKAPGCGGVAWDVDAGLRAAASIPSL